MFERFMIDHNAKVPFCLTLHKRNTSKCGNESYWLKPSKIYKKHDDSLLSKKRITKVNIRLP